MSYTEFYCQTTGNNLNAGSTTGNSAVYTGVGDSDGTSVFTPSDGSTPASSVNVGDWASIYVTAGATIAVFVGRVTVVAAGVNGAITVSTTAKSGTIPAASAGAHTITCKVGGAWQGPNAAVSFPFNFIAVGTKNAAGDQVRVNMLAGTYSITAAMTHSLTGPMVFQGYTTSPGDLGKATIDGGTSGASYILLTSSGVELILRDLIFQHNGSTGSANGIVSTGGRLYLERVVVNNICGSGIQTTYVASTAGGVFIECEVYAANTSNTANFGGIAIDGTATLVRCTLHDNTGNNNSGVVATRSNSFIDCIFCDNGLNGFRSNVSNLTVSFTNCLFYNNTDAGVHVSTNSGMLMYFENCTFANNGTYGINNSQINNTFIAYNCGFYSNTSGSTNGTFIMLEGTVNYGSAPMVDPANGDFLPAISTAKNAGRGAFTQDPGSFTKTTTSYRDIGAIQHKDTGTTGGVTTWSLGP